jgi:ABC-type nickel/cobalt efflux system permease component RcnA
METLIDLQSWAYRTIRADLTDLAASPTLLALVSLLPMGIAFGAVHALTPGHGKSVIATYTVGAQAALARSTSMALALALTHVASAVVIALAANFLISRSLGEAGRAPLLEMTSRLLLVVVGAWLFARAWRPTPAHDHGEGIAVGVAAGLVPCPLTLFVMFYALAQGVVAVGLAFALSMMTGIALVLCLVALLSVLTRDALSDLLQRHGGSATTVGRCINMIGGASLAAIGLFQLVR